MRWLCRLINRIRGKCNHRLVEGLGMYGDALTCIDCGYSKYPEVMTQWTFFTSTLLPETPDNVDLALQARAKRS